MATRFVVLPKCKDEVHVRTFEPPNFGHFSQFEKPLLAQRSMFAMNQQNAGELLRPKKLVNGSILSHCGEWIEWASSLSPLLGQSLVHKQSYISET